MRYSNALDVRSKFPDFQRAVVVATQIDNRRQDPQLLSLLQSAWSVAQSDASLADQPHVRVWDDAYRRFGVNPNRDTPSIKFLLNQAVKGKPVRSINPLVDILNLVSLRYSVPCGADDLDALDSDAVEISVARGDETFASLGKPEHIEAPAPGEIVYLTLPSRRVMCRRWNWRNAHFSRITAETTRALINVDAFVPPLESASLRAAADTMAELVTHFCGGRTEQYYLDAANSSFEIPRLHLESIS
jgi:DNA/RNA-binding domain of Phe-tRNA-synthetase-like protein